MWTILTFIATAQKSGYRSPTVSAATVILQSLIQWSTGWALMLLCLWPLLLLPFRTLRLTLVFNSGLWTRVPFFSETEKDEEANRVTFAGVSHEAQNFTTNSTVTHHSEPASSEATNCYIAVFSINLIQPASDNIPSVQCAWHHSQNTREEKLERSLRTPLVLKSSRSKPS